MRSRRSADPRGGSAPQCHATSAKNVHLSLSVRCLAEGYLASARRPVPLQEQHRRRAAAPAEAVHAASVRADPRPGRCALAHSVVPDKRNQAVRLGVHTVLLWIARGQRHPLRHIRRVAWKPVDRLPLPRTIERTHLARRPAVRRVVLRGRCSRCRHSKSQANAGRCSSWPITNATQATRPRRARGAERRQSRNSREEETRDDDQEPHDYSLGTGRSSLAPRVKQRHREGVGSASERRSC